MLLRDLARRLAATRPDALAYVQGDRRLSWSGLADRSGRFAAALTRMGLGAGDRVGIIAQDRLEMIEHWHGCLRTGVVRTGINWRYAPTEIDHIVRDGDLRLVLVQGSFAERLRPWLDSWTAAGVRIVGFGPDHGLDLDYESLLAESSGPPEEPALDADAPVALSYTSGSTGLPKGAVITQRGAWSQLFSAPYAGGFRADDVILNNLPGSGFPIFIHSYGMSLGATTVLPGLFDASEAVATVDRLGVTVMFAVPTMLHAIEQAAAAAGTSLPSLRLVITLGSPVVPAILDRARHRFGCEFQNWYGSTECTGAICMLHENDVPGDLSPTERELARSSVGRPLLHVDVDILDDDDHPVPPGTIGEICVRGPVLRGYHNLPEETARSLRNGWFHVGDLGHRDERGLIHLDDRRSFMIISGGYNVYPAVVERVLAEHRDVAEVAVVGAAHPRWGEAVVAVVVPVAGSTLDVDDLVTFCRDRVGRWEVPRHVEVVDALPIGTTGKVQKNDLRQWFRDDPTRLPWPQETAVLDGRAALTT